MVIGRHAGASFVWRAQRRLQHGNRATVVSFPRLISAASIAMSRNQADAIPFEYRYPKQKAAIMKKILSLAAATLLIAGLSAGTAQAKKRHHSNGVQTTGSAKGNSASSMSGKNSPASNATGSASPAGGGEK
jgi:hypothetical protein